MEFTGCLILLATPKFPCVRIKKKKKKSPELATPKKWPCPGLATSKKWQSPTMVSLGVTSPGLCHFLGVASPGHSHFRGWPVLDSVFFSGFWHIGKFGGGKKDQPPCKIL